MTWRDKARPIIASVLRDCKAAGLDEAATRARLREAYPFGERRYHPYKVWCDEVARQQGRKGKLGARKPKTAEASRDDSTLALWGES